MVQWAITAAGMKDDGKALILTGVELKTSSVIVTANEVICDRATGQIEPRGNVSHTACAGATIGTARCRWAFSSQARICQVVRTSRRRRRYRCAGGSIRSSAPSSSAVSK